MRAHLILITLIMGCNDGGVGSTKTFDDYQKSAIKVLCQFYTRCGLFSASRESACESQFAQQQQAAISYSIGEAISAGRLGYDADAAMSCLNAFSSSGCDLYALLAISSGGRCSRIYQPKVPVGGTCKAIIECVNGWGQQGTSMSGPPRRGGTPGALLAPRGG